MSAPAPVVVLPFTVEPWNKGNRDDTAAAGFNDYRRAKDYAQSLAADHDTVTITETIRGVAADPKDTP